MFNMKNNTVLVFMTIFTILPFTAKAQSNDFNEQDFFNSIKTSYYNLSQTKLKNLVSLVSSSKAEKFAKEKWKNPEVYPLQMIWLNPDKLYLSELGVPVLDEESQKEYRRLVDGLKMQLKGIFLDLQRFYLIGMFESIHPDYEIQHNEEAVQVSFTTKDATGVTRVKYLFGYNGLNILIQIEYPQQQKQIVIYPKFKTVKDKWLCTGWSVQNYILNEVSSGFEVFITNRYVNDIWVPGEILIEVQKVEEKDQKYYDQIFFRSYLFDQPLEAKKSTN